MSLNALTVLVRIFFWTRRKIFLKLLKIGNTPLHTAAVAFHVENIKLILSLPEGRKIMNTGNKDGKTALHLASIYKVLDFSCLFTSKILF
jgi:ankyrin repeat protein